MAHCRMSTQSTLARGDLRARPREQAVHHNGRQDAGFQVELLDGLTTHQRHEAEATCGDLHRAHFPD